MEEIKPILKDCYKNKPTWMKIDELRWKAAVRSVYRGENLLIKGHSGFGKTVLAFALSEFTGREHFIFNLGATQDPRTALIGKTHFKDGTFFQHSAFIRAIQRKNSIIILDEVSRAHPDAHNILMSVLDKKQRYLRVDEDLDTPVISVAEGVCFIGTANIGNQYTATLTIDRAFLDRWSILEIQPLELGEEIKLLQELYPNLTKDDASLICGVADATRKEVESPTPHFDTIISTRACIDIAGFMHDGFTFFETAELKIYPYYSNDGGEDSQLTHVKQIIQKFTKPKMHNDVPDDIPSSGTPWSVRRPFPQ
jgi:hypothetical protein